MASKKSSIPRATHDCDRPVATKSKLRVPKPPAKPNPSHIQSKPEVNDGLRKEDNDAVRRNLLHLEEDHARMKQTLEDTIREAEERIETMRTLMEARAKLQADQLSAASERTEELEEQVEGYELALLENNIDPASGEIVEPTEEQAVKIQRIKKVTKKDVSKMREKLQVLNENSDKYLIDVQNILHDIEEIEATSQRAGGRPVSASMSMTDDELTKLVKQVEETQLKEENEKKKKKKEEGEEDENDGEEDDEEEEEEEEEEEAGADAPAHADEEKGISRPQSKSDVFITEK